MWFGSADIWRLFKTLAFSSRKSGFMYLHHTGDTSDQGETERHILVPFEALH